MTQNSDTKIFKQKINGCLALPNMATLEEFHFLFLFYLQ